MRNALATGVVCRHRAMPSRVACEGKRGSGMANRTFALLGILALSGVFPVAAQQKPRIEKGTIQQTDVGNGKAMFTTYCAVCHGTTGKGDGPAAVALKKMPADLTKISARNGGTFPATKVSRFIEGADEIAAHGNRDMPVWGDLFRSLNPASRASATLRVSNLSDYLKSIQQ
jgi:mono/diheme cytochrome c family protein